MRRRAAAAGVALASAALLALTAHLSGGHRDVCIGTAGACPPSQEAARVCDRNAANTSELAAQAAAASAGQTVCLTGAGPYTFDGTNKAITIAPADGVDPVITATQPTDALNLGAGDCCFTLDGGHTSWTDPTGITVTGGTFLTNGVHDVTIKNTFFTGEGRTRVEGTNGPYPGVVWDHDVWHDMSGGNNASASWWMPGGNGTVSGITIENSLFRDNSADGIAIGGAVDILNNEFYDMGSGTTDAHTDAIQPECGCGPAEGQGSHIEGNFATAGSGVLHPEQGLIGGFNGTGTMTIEHNVDTNFTIHYLVLDGDSPASTVRYNTLYGGPGFTASVAQLDCSSKAVSSLTRLENNIAYGETFDNTAPCTPTTNTHNMLAAGASGLNFTGTPTFVGGSQPTSFRGFCLAAGSPGKTGATDGGEVGACGGGFNGGPPETYP